MRWSPENMMRQETQKRATARSILLKQDCLRTVQKLPRNSERSSKNSLGDREAGFVLGEGNGGPREPEADAEPSPR